MRIIGETETKEWLDSKGLLDSKGALSLSQFPNPISYKIPKDSGRKTALGKTITSFLDFESESLLWIHEYGIWPSSENMNLFHGFRKSLGEHSQLSEKPGHIFLKSELEAIASMLSMVYYFCWGAIIVPSTGGLLINISHDEVMDIFAKDKNDLSIIQESLNGLLRPS